MLASLRMLHTYAEAMAKKTVLLGRERESVAPTNEDRRPADATRDYYTDSREDTLSTRLSGPGPGCLPPHVEMAVVLPSLMPATRGHLHVQRRDSGP